MNKVARNVAVAVQDAVYSDIYNIALVVLRAARFLRRNGAAYAAIPALSWCSLCVNKVFLPLQDVTFLPFRTRLQLELLACMESANGDSYASCLKTAETALADNARQRAMEALVDPMPKETTAIIDACHSRLALVQTKHSFWRECLAADSGNGPDLKGQLEKYYGAEPSKSVLLATLLETLMLRAPAVSKYHRLGNRGLTTVGEFADEPPVPTASVPLLSLTADEAKPDAFLPNAERIAGVKTFLLGQCVELARPLCLQVSCYYC